MRRLCQVCEAGVSLATAGTRYRLLEIYQNKELMWKGQFLWIFLNGNFTCKTDNFVLISLFRLGFKIFNQLFPFHQEKSFGGYMQLLQATARWRHFLIRDALIPLRLMFSGKSLPFKNTSELHCLSIISWWRRKSSGRCVSTSLRHFRT